MTRTYIIKIILISICFTVYSAISQSKLSFDGYLLNLSIIQLKRSPISNYGHNYLQNIDRLRLRPEIYLSDHVNFSIEQETFIHYKNLGEFFSERYKNIKGQLFDLHFTLINNRLWQVTHFVDRMYMKINLEKISITFGRQRIAWGTGRIWNPTDLFNPIKPTNFAKIEKDGVDAALVKYNVATLTDLSVVINPSKFYTNYAFRFRTNFSEIDFSLMGGKFLNDFKIGADFAGNLLNAGIRGEIIASSRIVKYILGMDYQISQKIYFLTEYHFNGEGKSKKEFYDLYGLFNNNSIYLAKNYILFQFSYLVHPLSTVSILINQNMNDNSSFLSLNLSYSILDNLNLSWITNIFSGNRFTEYWYYTSSLLIRSEYYF